MQSIVRVLLPIIVVVGLVGGVTFMTQYAPPAPPKARPKPTRDPEAPRVFQGPSLVVPERVAVWDSRDIGYQQEFEVGSKGRFDFWAANGYGVPTRVFLKTKSCTCADVEVGTVDADAVVAGVRDLAVLKSARTLVNGMGLDPSGLPLALALTRVNWQPLVISGVTRDVPPADPRLGLSLAAFRMNWEAKNFGPQRLTAELTATGGDNKTSETRLEVPLNVVPAVQFRPIQVDLGALNAGAVRTVEYVLWSATHDDFPMVLPKLPDDPGFVFSTPLRLTADECARLGDQLIERYPDQAPTRCKSGYRVTLTVHERLGDRQLDLGPFTKRLNFNPGTTFEAVATVTGSVIGDVRLDGGDQIKLGDFPADLPKTKDVLVTTIDPLAELRVKGQFPEELQVTVKKKAGSLAAWELRVVVPANRLSGPLPAGSFVLLETVGPNPRRVRIPVSGNAYIR
jgi:hypothetical protein